MTSIEINLIGQVPKRPALGGGFSMPGDRAVLIAVLLVVVGFILAVGGNLYVNQQHADVLAQEETLQGEIKALDDKLKELAQLEQQQASLENRKKVLTYVTGKAYSWSELLDALRAATPRDEVTWDRLSLTGGGIDVAGMANDHQAAAYFLANLQNLKNAKDALLLEGVTLVSSERVPGKAGAPDLIRFVINGKVRP